jgi:hypothetical protein
MIVVFNIGFVIFCLFSYKNAIWASFEERNESDVLMIESLFLSGTLVRTRAWTTIQSTKRNIRFSSMAVVTLPALISRYQHIIHWSLRKHFRLEFTKSGFTLQEGDPYIFCPYVTDRVLSISLPQGIPALAPTFSVIMCRNCI